MSASDDVRTCVWATRTGRKHFTLDARMSPDSKVLLLGGSGALSAVTL